VQYGFAPERLSVGGYAEFHPIASNSSEEGRALNCRVDVVILSKPASAEMRARKSPSLPTPSPQIAWSRKRRRHSKRRWVYSSGSSPRCTFPQQIYEVTGYRPRV